MAKDKGGVLREQDGKAPDKSKAGEWRGPADDKLKGEQKTPPERIPSPGQPAGGE